MTPVFCTTKHDPIAGTFGDCLRACVASVLNLSPDDVPHFYKDGCDADVANERLRNWLFHYDRCRPFFVNFPSQASYVQLLDMMATLNPTSHYILYGRDEGGGDHAVVCCGGEMVHNPAWVPGKLTGAGSDGVWTVLVISAA